MKKMLLDILRRHQVNCEGLVGNNGEPLSDDVTNLIDLVQTLPSDNEMVSLRSQAAKASWSNENNC